MLYKSKVIAYYNKYQKLSAVNCLLGDKMVFILYNKIVKIYEKNNNQFKKVLFLEFYHKRLI